MSETVIALLTLAQVALEVGAVAAREGREPTAEEMNRVNAGIKAANFRLDNPGTGSSVQD